MGPDVENQAQTSTHEARMGGAMSKHAGNIRAPMVDPREDRAIATKQPIAQRAVELAQGNREITRVIAQTISRVLDRLEGPTPETNMKEVECPCQPGLLNQLVSEQEETQGNLDKIGNMLNRVQELIGEDY